MRKKLTSIFLAVTLFFVSAPVGIFAEDSVNDWQKDAIKVEAQNITEDSVKLVWNWDSEKVPEGIDPSEELVFSIFDGDDDLTGELENNEDGYSYSEKEGYSYVVEGLESGTDYELEVRSDVFHEENALSGKVEFSTSEAEIDEESAEDGVTPDAGNQEKPLSAGNQSEAGGDAVSNEAPGEDIDLETIGDFTALASGNSTTKNFLHLSWAEVENASKYVLWWSGDSFKEPVATINAGEELTYNKKITTRGENYTFRLQAFDENDQAVSAVTECKGMIPKLMVNVNTVSATTVELKVIVPKGYAGHYRIVKVYNGTSKNIKTFKNDGNKQTFTFKATKLTSAKPYKFYAVAANPENCKGVISNKRDVKTAVANVKQFRALSSANAVVLKWKKVPRATGYVITRTGNGAKKTFKVGSKSSYVDSTVGQNLNYTYTIKATKKNYTSSKTLAKVNGEAIRTMLLNITFGTTRTLTSHTGGSVSATFAKGTTVTATGFTNGKYIFYYNGREYHVMRVSISSASVKQLNADKTYSVEEATSYVNRMGLESRTPYLIWVNTYTQKLYIFKGSKGNWKLVQGPWLVATGKPSSPTSTGMTRIVDRMVSNGAPYWNVTFWFSLHGNAKVWGALGYPKSGACVRNTNEHAKWIFYNTPMQTAVYVF